jgi:uncharacterized 2Fe-2S/4Fe-4S cluster protein (DUF4445 family)
MSRILAHQGKKSCSLESIDGVVLLELLRRAGFNVSAPCGGHGKCGKCLVDVVFNGQRQTVLACQFYVQGDCEVFIPDFSGGSICADGDTGSVKLSTGRSGYGAAADIGTTTVAVKLFNLATGEALGDMAAWNAQAPYGADVISRCQYTMEHTDGLELLCNTIRNQIFSMAQQLLDKAGIASPLSELYIVGNTVMEHIFMGLSPAGLAVAPFKAESLFTGCHSQVIDGVQVFAAPCAASYVGGDIMSGLLSTDLCNSEETCLFLDVGTNGEMALGNKDGFVCCAVASGPAFEGAGISCGMASTPGAIVDIHWSDAEPKFDVIGDVPPKGLCGSGLIRLLALLLEKGIVDETGWLMSPDEAPEGFDKWLTEDENGNGCFNLTDKVYLSAADVRQLQLAKAAVAAGIEVLMAQAGISYEDIKHVYLAGGFGSHLDPEAAAAIGMIPKELSQKTRAVGNSALAGAVMATLDLDSRRRLDEIQASCRYIELSGNSHFNQAFPEHMMFCEEDEEWN